MIDKTQTHVLNSRHQSSLNPARSEPSRSVLTKLSDYTRTDVTRRQLLIGSVAMSGLVLAGCTTTSQEVQTPTGAPVQSPIPPFYASVYAAMPNEQFPIPAVDLSHVPERFWRRQVDYQTDHPVGTIVVDRATFFLHFVQEGGKAMRYGVGLGRAGFSWSGQGTIAWKRPWPKWTPPAEMIAREPELEQWSAANGGMPPGLNNPLGARALYIFEDGVDTLYRIHGSPEYWTIGKAVSSGCVRLINQDVIDLYNRVPPGAELIVK
jgi:lipoprotein-anchoring transpeptidase ErfK/SrfK